MNKFLHTNKKTIFVVAGIGAVSAAVFAFAYSKLKPKKRVVPSLLKQSLSLSFLSTEISLSNDGLPEVVTFETEKTPKEQAKRSALINVEFNEWHYFTVNTMKDFIETLIQFSLPGYTELIKEMRNKRRGNKEDLESYVWSNRDFMYNLDELLDKCQKDVLLELGLSENLYDKSVTYYTGCCNKEIIQLRNSVPEKLKALLKPSKILKLTELKEILRIQIEFTGKLAENVKLFAENINNPNDVPHVLGNKIYDLLFSKYAVEEEDLAAAIQSFKEDAEVEKLTRELKAATKKLIVA